MARPFTLPPLLMAQPLREDFFMRLLLGSVAKISFRSQNVRNGLDPPPTLNT